MGGEDITMPVQLETSFARKKRKKGCCQMIGGRRSRGGLAIAEAVTTYNRAYGKCNKCQK